jgi:cytoskeletal protein CcmA (bactofilin family)
MKWRIARAPLVALVLLVALAVPQSAHAMTLRQGDSVVIGKAETIDDDVYAFGATVQIDGTINGDVVAAGQSVIVTGKVTGSVFAAGQTVRITGSVGGSVRASGADVQVDGAVSRDVLASGATVTLGSAGTIGRDAALAGSTVTIGSSVGRNADIAAATARLDAPVEGKLGVDAQSITLGSGAKIGGDFEYWSNAKPSVAGSVAGATIPHASRSTGQGQQQSRSLVSGAIGWIQGLVGWVIFGLLALLVMPVAFADASARVIDKPWPSLGIGFGVMAVPPMLALPVLLLTIFIGGWWIAFAAMAVWFVLLCAGFVAGVLAVGTLIGRRMSSVPSAMIAMLIGLVVVHLIGAVPFVGWLVTLAATMVGTGALAALAWSALRQARTAPPAETPLPAIVEPAAEG